jgi:hypothetical protein
MIPAAELVAMVAGGANGEPGWAGFGLSGFRLSWDMGGVTKWITNDSTRSRARWPQACPGEACCGRSVVLVPVGF